jgi:hypothetical protein
VVHSPHINIDRLRFTYMGHEDGSIMVRSLRWFVR